MKVVVRAQALDDIDDLYAWISRDNQAAALDMVRRVRERISRLQTEELTYMGHPGLVKGTLELLVRPYIVVYKVYKRRREILVLSVIHGARHRS